MTWRPTRLQPSPPDLCFYLSCGFLRGLLNMKKPPARSSRDGGNSGTDGRPIIRKKTSVTGRQMRPVKLFMQGTSLLYLWIGVGIFYPQSFDIGKIEEASISTDKDGFWRL